jgi:RNA polymerase sigma factor (sigma-70 family)
MARRQLHDVVHYLRRVTAPTESHGISDVELLERFVRGRDEAAFELLVWRHRKMVFDVCRRILRDSHEAEDAFQATFLVLARRAGSIGRGTSLGGWLYKVAYRVALTAHARAARRGREVPLADLPARDANPATAAQWHEVRLVIDDEVNRLIDKYRLPFVLCYFEGKSNADAARELGCPVGTIESRLTRARQRLRAGLAQRGVVLSAPLAAFLVAPEAPAAVSAAFLASTVRGALWFALNPAAPENLVSTEVTLLTQGVLRTMFLSRLKLVSSIVLILGIGGGAAGVVGGATLAARLTDDPQASPTPLAQHPHRAQATSVDVENGVVQKVDSAQRTITIVSRPESGPLTHFIGTTSGGRGLRPPDLGIELAAVERKVATSARILIDGTEGKLEDLAPETSVKLTLTRSSVVIRVEATGSTMQSCFVKGLDLIKLVLTVSHYGNQYQYKLGHDARVVIDGRHSTLTDLKEDMPVVLDFSAVGKRVIGIRATGPTVACVVKEVDSTRRTLKVRLTQEHLTVPGIRVAIDARIVLNGQGATLADLKPGMSIALQMSADPDSSQVLGIQTLLQNNQHD